MRSDTRRLSGQGGFRLDKGLALATFLLLAATFCLGHVGLSVSRLIFILGSASLGWWAAKIGPPQHVAITIALFAFAPFLRRVVDLQCGFNESGIMLSGPLIAMLPPSLDLLKKGMPGGKSSDLGPYILVGACTAYGVGLSLFDGQFIASCGLALKWGAPLIYGVWILRSMREGHDILGAVSKAFLLTMPIVGIYGISQYVDPPQWDRVWMVFSKMNSIGNPEPYQVRVFSTMNSPASCASYLIVGIILLWLRRDLWLSSLLAMPMAATLLLSLYRTAWVSLLSGILLCGVFQATRKRTIVVMLCLAGTAVIALGSGQFGDALSNRFSTFSSGEDDGSVKMRMSEYAVFYQNADKLLVGWGLANLNTPGTFGLLDGTVIQVLVGMGLFVGPIFMLSLLWAASRALFDTGNLTSSETVVVRALVLGQILQMPLGNVTGGELGFLFWLVIGIAAGRSEKRTLVPRGVVSRLGPTHYPVTTLNQTLT